MPTRASKARLSRLTALLVPICLLLSACEPKWNLPPEDFDVVLTLYDDEVDFGAIRTYTLPDSIVHIFDTTGDHALLSRQNDELILDLVAENLDSLGYLREYEPEEVRPDVLVLVWATAEWQHVHFTSYAWWSAWGWYPGADNYWGEDWGFAYPWGRTYTSEFPAGTLYIDMLDFEHLDWDNGIVPVIWSAVINGVLQDTDENVRSRLVELINRSFAQSPYFGATWDDETRLDGEGRGQ